MCGIFGLAYYGRSVPLVTQAKSMRKVCRNLMIESEIRGDDASGICVLAKNEATIYKNYIPASKMVKRPTFNKALINIKSDSDIKAVLGHARSKTKGTRYENENNHPIIAGKVVGVHNGTIWNDELIYNQEAQLERRGKVDSEIIFRLIDMYASKREINFDVVEAVKLATRRIAGSYACAFIHLDVPDYLTLFRNNGKGMIYLYNYDDFDTMLFASENTILDKAIEKNDWFGKIHISDKMKLADNRGVRINLKNGKLFSFNTEKCICHANQYYFC